MQYIRIGNTDLQPGYSTYVLNASDREVRFYAYSGETAINTNERGVQYNAYKRGYFLRKGFSSAISSADPKVLTPIYTDNDDNDVYPKSDEEAIKLIYEGKLSIRGFKFTKTATAEQKEEAIGRLIDEFVFASKNLDFSSDKNLFLVQANFMDVAYNNGGPESMQIKGVDVQERLGLNTQSVIANRILKQKMIQAKQKI